MISKLINGTIVLSPLDLFLISISTGSVLKHLIAYIRKENNITDDPIVVELKRISPQVIPVYTDGSIIQMKNPPLIRLRGGKIRIHGIEIESKKIAKLIAAIQNFNRRHHEMRLVQATLYFLNNFLTISYGLRIAIGGELNILKIILIIFPGTLAGYLLETMISNPFVSILGPLVILFGRDIETLKLNEDDFKRCRAMCEVAAQEHNKAIGLEMKNLGSAVEEAALALKLPIDEVPLACVEEPLSIYQRFKLRKLAEAGDNAKVNRRIKYFSDMIQEFPECNNPDVAYDHIMKNLENNYHI